MNVDEVFSAHQSAPALEKVAMIQDECVANEYRPSNKDVLRDYKILIEFLSIGCLIKVGCRSIPFSTIKEGIKALNDYVANPYETKKIWEERFAEEIE